MDSTKRGVSLQTVLLVLAIAGLVGLFVGQRASGNRPFAAPSSVVVVNIPKVLESLSQRSEAEAGLRVLAEEMLAEDESRQLAVEEMKTQLADIPESDTAAREAFEEKIILTQLENAAWRAFAQEQIDMEKSLLLRDLDRSIQAAIEELAQTNGYDVILNNDSDRVLKVNHDSNVPRELQVKQQMTARRVLYGSPVVDITDELIERMNNAFNAG